MLGVPKRNEMVHSQSFNDIPMDEPISKGASNVKPILAISALVVSIISMGVAGISTLMILPKLSEIEEDNAAAGAANAAQADGILQDNDNGNSNSGVLEQTTVNPTAATTTPAPEVIEEIYIYNETT